MKAKSLIFFATLLFAITSCRTIDIVDKSKIEYERKDSISYIHTRDTIYIEKTITIFQKDSSTSEKADDTQINFQPSGGTYNAITGEATNVLSISVSKREKELTTLLKNYQSKEIEFSATEKELRDEISALKTATTTELSTKKEANNSWKVWLILCLISFASGIAVIIVLKKLPYTKPFFFWL